MTEHGKEMITLEKNVFGYIEVIKRISQKTFAMKQRQYIFKYNSGMNTFL